MYAEVLVEIKAKAIDKTFTYIIPQNMHLEKGERVLVPFGKRNIEGFILDIKKEGTYDYPLKQITKQIDEKPVINEEMLKLGKYISQKTLAPLISSYQTMLPTALKAKNKKNINKKYIKILKINSQNPILKTEKQKTIFNLIKEKGELPKKDAILISPSAVKTLIQKKYIKEINKETYRLKEEIKINKTNYNPTEQQKTVISKVNLNNFNPYLLHGVTGSGKTLVYIKLIEKIIKENKEAILLVPEISLTPQVVKIFKTHFGKIVAILHSALSDGEKYDEWRKIEKKEVKIAIGARSAIFAPFTNLGIIIIDEEHSATYKQENIPKYNTIDIAIQRAKTHNIPLILSSATPSIESYTRAKMNVYTLLEMKNRVNNTPPTVKLVDMKEEYKKGNRVFSSLVTEKVNDVLKKGEQIIMLLNRRGYSTIITCKECGYTHKCPNCDIPLTYHKNTNQMQCHYCNYKTNKLIICPNCHSKNINSLGMGTEKLEALVKETFQMAKVIRMDNDTTRNKGAHQKIIEDFANQKYNILVGTQMISKGLDFPKVTLVCVINGDSTLNIPDFRSAERTYELLSQVSGRAGRADLKGEVIIQGFNINHYSITSASQNNYEMFYKEEMKIRKILKYPPYYNLAYIKICGKNYEEIEKESEKIAYYLKKQLPQNIILGPSAASIPKINNTYYIGIIIKYKNTKEILAPVKFINDKYKTNSKVNVYIDLNPTKL